MAPNKNSKKTLEKCYDGTKQKNNLFDFYFKFKIISKIIFSKKVKAQIFKG